MSLVPQVTYITRTIYQKQCYKRKYTKLDFSYIQISGKYVFKWSPYVCTYLLLIDNITTRLLIISCNSIMLTITIALHAGSVDHVIIISCII